MAHGQLSRGAAVGMETKAEKVVSVGLQGRGVMSRVADKRLPNGYQGREQKKGLSGNSAKPLIHLAPRDGLEPPT
jgi:hypothetical protein